MQLTQSKISKWTLNPFLLMLDDLSPKDKNSVEAMLRKEVSGLISEGLKN